MKTKLRTKVFRIILSMLFIVYITLFISNKYGYYEYKKHEQVTLTAEQIVNFENDVKNGKEVNIESYLANSKPNYQTKFSKLGLDISNGISSFVKGGVESIFQKLNKLVTE